MSSRILIVDDETNVRLNYRITLETEGYEVFEAGTSASALQELLERPFALAILDLRMPGMDGLASADQGSRGQTDARGVPAAPTQRCPLRRLRNPPSRV